jgi:putative restriction endonuclease
MDLVAQGIITTNFVEPSFELVETFNAYWNRIMPSGSKSSMAHPFPRLQTDGFWKRVAKPGYDSEADYNVTSMLKLREIYAGATMDDELFQLMCNPEMREQLRTVLVKTYFVPEIRPIIVQQGLVNYEAHVYTKMLLKVAEREHEYGKEEEETDQRSRVRDQGFRKAIVALYQHRCALCGVRMLTPEGHSVVDPLCQYR